MPERPPNVPPDARWSEIEEGWAVGPRDEDGELHGEVSYYRADGTRCCLETLVHGKVEGISRRFHPNGELSQQASCRGGVLHGTRTWYATDGPTTEKMHTPGMSREVVRIEVDYVEGRTSDYRFFLADGTRVLADGTPVREPPPGLPAGAIFQPKGEVWIEGTFNERGEQEGRFRCWSDEGVLLADERYQGGQLHGRCVYYHHPGGVRSAELELRRGLLHGQGVQLRPDGSVARRGRFAEGMHSGALEDLSPDGHVERTRRFERPAAAQQRQEQPQDRSQEQRQEQRLLDELESDEPSARTTALEHLLRREDPLSPQDLTRAIGRGWSLEPHEEPAVPRAYRSLVRKVAPAPVQQALAACGLDRAPRLWTTARATQVARALGALDQVDRRLLEDELSGGPDGVLALASGEERAVAALRARISDRRMNLSHMALDAVPPEVARFASVHQLDLSNNRLTALPAALADMFSLRKLEANHNRLNAFAAELSLLMDLRGLHIAHNGLEAAPEALFELQGLQILNLSNNALRELPAAMGRLKRLHTLWLNDNPLETLPEAMSGLESLTFLHLGDHGWEEPPGCVFRIASLEELWLASPNLRRLPPEIGRLRRLRRLHLWYSGLESVPEELYELPSLEEVRISHTPVAEVVKERLGRTHPDCTVY